jgi:hypothetical protein
MDADITLHERSQSKRQHCVIPPPHRRLLETEECGYQQLGQGWQAKPSGDGGWGLLYNNVDIPNTLEKWLKW